MKRGFVWVILLSLLGLGGVWSVQATTFTSPNFSINGNLGDSIAGGQTSASYRLTSAGGESIAGSAASTSYKLGEGYVPTLDNALQLNVQPKNQVGYWSFDQGAGSTIVDDSINNTSAVQSSGVTSYTTGKVGQAITGFSASNYLSASNDSVFNVSGLTSCVWMNLSSTGTNPVAFARAPASPTADGMWSIGFGTGLTPRIQFRMNGATTTLNSPAAVTTGSWNQVCLTYDGTKLVMYQNGAEAANQSLTGTMASFSQAVTLGSAAAGAQPFSGVIDEAKLFSRALSASEIKADYDAATAGISAAISLGTITPGVSQTAAFDSIVQTAAPGYSLAINQTANLTKGIDSISGIGGSIGSPLAWSEGTTKGLGFTLYGTNATALPGSWGAGASYAALPSTATTFYSRSGYTGGTKDIVNMRLRLDTPASQPAGNYTSQMVITGTMIP